MEVESDQDQDDCDVMIEPAAALRGLYAMMVSWCDQFLDIDIDIEEEGDRSVPPLLMIHFPRLFERAWGNNRLYPQALDDWCPYRAYLQKFCDHNAPRYHDPDAYKLCMDQEIRLKSEWLYKHTHVPHDEISLSDNIQNCAYELIRSNSGEGDSPISMIAATCVAKESELIVERLSCHPSLLDPEESPHESTQIRMFALSCMKGSQACSDAALLVKKAALLGITIEAGLMTRNLRDKYYDSNVSYLNRLIRRFALEVVRQKFDGSLEHSAHDDYRYDFVARLEEDAENHCRDSLVNSDPASEEKGNVASCASTCSNGN